MTPWTDWPIIRELAKRQGVKKPSTKVAHCAECGAPESIFGLMHWPDCESAWDEEPRLVWRDK